ncbi:hypothetical protein FC650_21520 [Vibrio natriegens]|uniref:hypothetical protein n=1 Tax=Vibrio natriegens TaxID=691 RepID=UPI0015939465|nr:hypothetical protein [Vibrio natriegens]NVC96130.1 hypothetical protein [Vibrio natriegens]
MNGHTKKQILTIMAPYHKPGISYRKKQVKRLLAILDDIFRHEPYVGENLNRVGRRQLIGYWERTKNEGERVRQEKYAILKLFFENTNLKVRVPKPKSNKQR